MLAEGRACNAWLPGQELVQRPEQEGISRRGRLADRRVSDGALLPQQFFPQRHAHPRLGFEVKQGQRAFEALLRQVVISGLVRGHDASEDGRLR